eukprot:COSAG02_NODE_90_length_37755_cov_29.833364_6_plen_77_part_00
MLLGSLSGGLLTPVGAFVGQKVGEKAGAYAGRKIAPQLLLPLALSATAGSTVHGAAYLINVYFLAIIVVFSNCREN